MDRNFILALVLSMGVLLSWEAFVAGPQREALEAQRKAAAARAAEAAPAGDIAGGGADAPGSGVDAAGAQDVRGLGRTAEIGDVTLDEALANAPGRVRIETPSLSGSINLAGGRIDDLQLKKYREAVDPDSAIIRLLSPREAEHGHYIQQGWIANGRNNQAAVWSQATGDALTPSTPVTLTRRQGALVFEKTFSVDENYMFTVAQTIRNEGGEEAQATPYGLVIQRGVPNDLKNFMILHEGPIGIVDKSLYQRKYDRVVKKGGMAAEGDQGWVGITNKYWLAAAIPPQGENFQATLDNVGTQQEPIFRASYSLAPRVIAPGETATLTSYLFGGAKDVDILQSYEAKVENGGLNVYDFDKAVDWGNFFFLTRPIFYTLDFFGDLIGNWGVAILILTLIIKGILFPLANKSYESMSKMKKLQPEIEKLRKRYDDDKMKLQQEMMALYKKEKMNPLAGCLPILLQMPIFYALYKTLFVTIELRHEPFIAWIKDLSAPDPTSIFNLFGLIPYEPTAIPVIGAFLGVGVLPLLMGVAMWFQTKLNPPPPDPTQAQIFAMMPIIFTFLFASFAAGLVLYWFWNTALSIAQQWVIMKRNGVDVDWGERLPFLSPKTAAANANKAPDKSAAK
ncbi:MAG: membrane protein insertase YidC [Pseudomonadota bacterium]